MTEGDERTPFNKGAVVVAGGTGGFGQAICEAFVRAGSPLAFTFHSRQQAASELEARLSALGPQVRCWSLDLADAAQCEERLADIEQRFGGIHSIVYAAGPRIGMDYVSRLSPPHVAQVLPLDVCGFFHLAHAAIPLLKRNGGGSITAITTTQLQRVELRGSMSAVPKVAIEAFVRAIAREEARYRIRANSVRAGWTDVGLGAEALSSRLSDAAREAIFLQFRCGGWGVPRRLPRPCVPRLRTRQLHHRRGADGRRWPASLNASALFVHPSMEIVMTYVVRFDSRDCADAAVAGGKGANLAALTGAGFPVPEGFVVTAQAYAQALSRNGLDRRIAALLAGLDFADYDELERCCAAIRALIEAAPVPGEMAAAIAAAYAALGEHLHVAVRSSGTAEDLAEASFAGQHDTYLDIRGESGVLDAVRCCWASLWTARATAYRQQKGFDHGEVQLAVVVQKMVSAEVSGVLFTANPMTTAADRLVVNASWGLGEGIVSGVLEPDQFIIDRDTLAVKERRLGSKALRVVRDPVRGVGTVHEQTPEADRARWSLSDAQLRQLAQLGLKVSEHYGDWPQDIEWAYAGGRLYLLQSRDITGVDFSWDEDLEDYSELDPPADDTVWSNNWAREIWCGQITPLFYSLRGEIFTKQHTYTANLWGFPEVGKLRYFKYRKGTVYFNSKIDYLNHINTIPPAFRSGALLPFVPPKWYADLERQPFSWTKLIALYARLKALDPVTQTYRWLKHAYWKEAHEADIFIGLPPERLRELSDAALKREVLATMRRQQREYTDASSGLFFHVPLASGAMMWLLQHWYNDADPMLFSDLITGLPERTLTQTMNLELYDLARDIKAAPVLRALFDAHPGAAFFAKLASEKSAAAFHEKYRCFLKRWGHRGHSDRDIIYKRRSEDPGIDYDALSSMLSTDEVDHDATERKLIARRDAAASKVIAKLQSQPLGTLRVEVFKLLHDFLLRFFIWRDNERNHADRGTWAKKKVMEEVGRRLRERGVLDGDEDFYYLSKNELLRLLDGNRRNLRVVKAKIDARRRNCDRCNVEWIPPMHLQGDTPVNLDADAPDTAPLAPGEFRGLGTSRGATTGVAKVIGNQKDLKRLQKGDILVTSSTDPGWTPAFLVISGLVLETGGMLAHGSCISREYGIPAVVMPNAMKLIEDGARVSVCGDTGEVKLLPAVAISGTGEILR